MKGMRERFLKKMKSNSTITTLKQGLFFQVNPLYERKEQEHSNDSLSHMVPCKISLSDLINNVKDEDFDPDFHASNMGISANHIAPVMNHGRVTTATEFDSDSSSTFTSPDDIQSLTEPQACNFELQAVAFSDISTSNSPNSKSQNCSSTRLQAFWEQVVMEIKDATDHQEYSSLHDFEEKCPAGGSNAVILYTTSLRGIRKTFDDCNTIRFLLESFRVLIAERDVSMHMEFREELWRILGGRVVPPRLFIRGRHIGGADEVVRLHEQGKLRKLLEGIPITTTNCPCHGCGGVRFLLCFECNGSRKIKPDNQDSVFPTTCTECNENGLVHCPICSKIS